MTSLSHALSLAYAGNGTLTRIILRGLATWMPTVTPPQPNSAPDGPDPPMTLLMPVVSEMRVAVDRSCSGGASQDHAQGGDVDLPPSGVPHWEPGIPPPTSSESPGSSVQGPSAPPQRPPPWGRDPWGGAGNGSEQDSDGRLPLHLAVWVDHSVVEVFAMGGHGRVTSRIYPLVSASSWGVSVWARCAIANVSVLAEVHQVDSAWLI